MDLRLATSQMVVAFEATNEYKELSNVVQEINKNPQYKKSFENLRQLQKKLYGGNVSEQEASKLMNDLTTQYNTLQTIPIFVKYFEVSNKFDQLFSLATNDIAKNLENKLMQ